MSIGIAITTHNRRRIANKSINELINIAPKDAYIVVVDDASDVPYENDSVDVYRFSQQVGIARAKNKCLELLEDCDHIFLFDDDIYPVTEGWEQRYIQNGEKHLCYTWHVLHNGKVNANVFLHTDYAKGVDVYHRPCGVMLYLQKEVLEVVGGMDNRFIGWGYEHVEYSQRIYNTGLTSYPFQDVIGSKDLFYSYDYHKETTTSVPKHVYKRRNEILWLQNQYSNEYKPYKNSNVLPKRSS